MFHGLAKSTRRAYSASQRRFLEFCYWSKLIHDNGSPLPASEQTLMLFAAHLSRTIKASSIKVYLSGVRSLHIEHGFNNPLENCFLLECVLRGIKRIQGTGIRQRLPITISTLRKLSGILNLNNYSDSLFWVACLTGFFGFLRCGEFTTSSSQFDINTNLAVPRSSDRQTWQSYACVTKYKGLEDRPVSSGACATDRDVGHQYLCRPSAYDISPPPW